MKKTVKKTEKKNDKRKVQFVNIMIRDKKSDKIIQKTKNISLKILKQIFRGFPGLYLLSRFVVIHIIKK